MADTEVLKKLKDVPFKIQTASLKERREVIEEIQDVLATPGITEPAVRFVCRVVTSTLHRYRDTTSQFYVKTLLTYLSTNHREWTLRSFLPLLLDISENLRNTVTSKSTCQSGLFALHWSAVVAESSLKNTDEDGVDYNSLVLSQANLLAVVTAYGNKKKNNKAFTALHASWKAIGKTKATKWFDVLSTLPADSGPQVPIIFSALCRHFRQTGDEEIVISHKAKMMDSFIKSLISVKNRPNAHYISGCADMLHMVTLEDVKDSLLPALQKAMLRSPETIIQAVGEVFANLQLFVDGIAVDIGKSLIGNLHSKDQWARAEANKALGHLARRCSALPAARTLLTSAFAEYHGASGKLTSSEDKIAVLQGAGTLSELAVSEEDFTALYEEATSQVARVLDSESHERTLCVALDVLSLWTQRLRAPLHPKVYEIFKKNLSAKNSTPAVRSAYMSLVSRAVRGGVSAAHAQALRPTLLTTLERAATQPPQHPVLNEAISAMLGLILMDEERQLASKTAVWSMLVHPEKHVLLQDRVLAAAPDDVLTQVVLVCSAALERYAAVARDGGSPLYRALVLVLLSTAKPVRTAALREVSSLLAREDRAQVARFLALKLNEVLEEGKIFTTKEKTSPEEKTEVTGKIILDCVHAICSYRDYPSDELERLAIDILPSCHHPVAAAGGGGGRAWLRLLAHLRLQPRDLVARHCSHLRATYIDGYTPTPTMSNIVSSLVAANEQAVGGAALAAALDALRAPDLLRVSRDEYFVFLTPPGDLYDKSVVPGNDDGKEMNLKRESKAYSYKEQLEELQLRRELEEKRRREGQAKQVPLSAKQKEAIKLQLAKESIIRDRLTALNDRVVVAEQLVSAVQAGSASAVCQQARHLVSAVLAALRSPLAAPRLAPLFLRLRPALLPRHALLGDTVARVALRLHKPQCDLEPCWEEEELGKATVRTIGLLHAATVEPKPGAEADASAPPPSAITHLTAPGFCYIFPLLKQGLTGPARADEAAMVSGLAVIARHARLRGDPLDPRDMLRPALLPIDHMFRLLIDVISNTSKRVQAAATLALLETAECAARGDLSLDDATCLLAGLQNPQEVVRDAALRALLCVADCLSPLLDDLEHGLEITKRLYIATFDVSEDNKKLAYKLWSMVPRAEAWLSGAEAELVRELVREVQHPAEPVQRAAADALATLVARAYSADCAPSRVMHMLHDLYVEKYPVIPAKLDQFGHEREAAVDEWGARRGAALGLRALAPRLTAEDVPAATAFFVQRGLADRRDEVREEMLAAAMAVVDLHGKETLSSQLPVFENFLDTAPKSGRFDAVRQCVVLLVGSLARHLEPHDARIRPITLRLVAALSTPSQPVQDAVSNCLPHLVTSPALAAEIQPIMNKLMKQLLTAEKYGDRRGAAYGIAGVIKGLGILSLKQLDVMGKLTEAIQEKKNYKYREGALFGFEILCYKLGRLFEPYIVHVLPHLLMCFGDSSQYVRAAADDTAKLIMSKLSAHGVKLVLPSLLQALQDDNWRTKAGSIELLGAMAYCAPKQLSSCLPSIVPKLIEVLSDSHTKVQEASVEALGVIGSVIRNPEIQAIVPVLLHALKDPSNMTSACLQTLLDTKFVHFIDAPSLALIMPVVQRAFQDRSTETRKMAAQIIGNMYSLTDQKDLLPYLPNIIPGLKSSLLDPVPEVRSVSARALGAMVRGMGESSFEELLPWLMQTLTSESSSVDRSGAAQGLSEVVAGLGVEKLHKLMPDIIATAERTDIAPHVKDGYIMMFIYMPGAFTDEFTPYIGQIINPILKALADENEYVRETALKAGQRIVTLYAESAIALLLPQLERGLFDDNWRIRYSSVQLLGDLLYRISGVSGKMSTETASEDDNFGTEHSHRAIMSALGAERRNRVLAGLYMGRSDVALMVRQAALHVWKVVVTNTPKTLREILPTLFGLLLGCLASTSYDKRQVAARTLGDLVRKLGERVLPEIVPILERGLRSDRADQRQGVCIGLGEILASTSRDAVLSFADGLVPTVRTALCDPLPEVRMAAARTFDSLHATIGNKALDDILPPMLAQLHDADTQRADAALDGLKQIMAIKSRAVLPYLIPVLTGTGGTGGGADTRALSALAAAAGSSLSRYLPRVLPALLAALLAARGSPHEARELDQCRDALLPVVDDAGVRCIIDMLLEAVRTSSGDRRRAAAALLCAFVSHSRADLAPHVPQLLRGLLLLFADTDRDVLQMAWEALSALTRTLDAERQMQHVSDVRQAVRYAAADLKPGDLLPGFCLPKGIAPILPLFREAILNGLPEDKEGAALMLGEVIRLTSAAALQPSVVHVTGPLIRILGDRFNAAVKAAVLETLAELLSKVGVMLKQFLPQLQTTFLKALHDSSRTVRIKAGLALSQLVLIHTRADPLFVEMHNGVRNAEDAAVRETMLQALRGVLTAGGQKMSEQLALAVLATLTTPALLAHPDDPPRSAVGGCLGALIQWLPTAHRDAAIAHHVLGGSPAEDWLLQHGRSCALFVALKESPQEIYREPFLERVERTLLTHLASERAPVACNAVRGIGYLARHLLQHDRPLPHNLLSQFVRSMNHSSNEVKQLMARASALLGREAPLEACGGELLRALLPALVNGTKEKNTYVRANSELALRAVLRLPHDEHFHQKCLVLLEEGAREALSDVVARVLRRAHGDARDARDRDEDLDCTLLT
ncbi:PREDICTED: translational activator GCN1 isoform X1 [Papilio xuthus]|uniref:Translational activator GCN1 isoform X1 n=1 Tax=Papilio xuthus TaxID=66420 RepID=A0AAJ7ELD3_PAPXU|nr:PREDICTED: translational activator GCN1 isoform X1 [Papilio xuthus]